MTHGIQGIGTGLLPVVGRLVEVGLVQFGQKGVTEAMVQVGIWQVRGYVPLPLGGAHGVIPCPLGTPWLARPRRLRRQRG